MGIIWPAAVCVCGAQRYEIVRAFATTLHEVFLHYIGERGEILFGLTNQSKTVGKHENNTTYRLCVRKRESAALKEQMSSCSIYSTPTHLEPIELERAKSVDYSSGQFR